MKHIVTTALLATLIAASAASQEQTETSLLDINARARADWQNTWHHSETLPDASGFEGKYLMVRFDGEITPGITYSWRQRFNKSAFDSNFFDATDWLTLTYTSGKYSASAGKEIVAIGGWEYDRNPVDLYATSLFWQNVACYQWGVSGAVNLTNDDSIMAQVTQSMFHTPQTRNMYGYNLMYTGNHGPWQALYSLNLTEYAPGRYINYISLGNRFTYGEFTLELDLMNRYAHGQTFLGKDMSLVSELAWKPAEAWRITGKYTYDVNRANTGADTYIHSGTELNMAGGAIEFYPLKKNRTSLRLHAGAWHMWGHNTDQASGMQPGNTLLSCGLTWDMNLLSLKRKH